jgi:hypothetical protein
MLLDPCDLSNLSGCRAEKLPEKFDQCEEGLRGVEWAEVMLDLEESVLWKAFPE